LEAVKFLPLPPPGDVAVQSKTAEVAPPLVVIVIV